MQEIKEVFNYLFSLKNEQIMFILFLVCLYIIYKKYDDLIKKADKKLDEKEVKLLEIIEKVNDTQLELIKSLGKIRGKIDNNQTAIINKLDQIKDNLKR